MVRGLGEDDGDCCVLVETVVVDDNGTDVVANDVLIPHGEAKNKSVTYKECPDMQHVLIN